MDAYLAEVWDPEFAIGDPDVVVPACISCDGGVVREDPVGVVVDVVVVVGTRQYQHHVASCSVVVTVRDGNGSWCRVIPWM